MIRRHRLTSQRRRTDVMIRRCRRLTSQRRRTDVIISRRPLTSQRRRTDVTRIWHVPAKHANRMDARARTVRPWQSVRLQKIVNRRLDLRGL